MGKECAGKNIGTALKATRLFQSEEIELDEYEAALGVTGAGVAAVSALQLSPYAIDTKGWMNMMGEGLYEENILNGGRLSELYITCLLWFLLVACSLCACTKLTRKT